MNKPQVNILSQDVVNSVLEDEQTLALVVSLLQKALRDPNTVRKLVVSVPLSLTHMFLFRPSLTLIFLLSLTDFSLYALTVLRSMEWIVCLINQ